MTLRVVFAPEAQADLLQLYDTIADRGSPRGALAYTERVMAYCESFATFPERGTRRDDLRPGLRVIGFGRRVAIAFHVDGLAVTIDRILYGGRDLEAAMRDEEP